MVQRGHARDAHRGRVHRADAREAAADEGARKRRIELVDVTGNAAVGKIVLDYPDAYIVDYMSLLKTNGEWRIINKIFMTEMKKK